jgi:hypothetical protein
MRVCEYVHAEADLTEAVFDAAPFQNPSKPLRFRGISDSLAKYHLEASECCLIHADNPLTKSMGVWLNPTVRVGYNSHAYDWATIGGEWPSPGRLKGWLLTYGSWLLGLPQQKGDIAKRFREWQRQNPTNHEPGTHCLVDEMQVLVGNGWAHV